MRTARLRRGFTPVTGATARLPQDHGVQPTGLDPAWSRLMEARVQEPGGARHRTFHVLDTGPLLAERGLEPQGTLVAVHGNPTWSYLWRSVVEASLERADAVAAGSAEGPVWRVIAPDQLDMGFSERLSHPGPPRPARHGASTSYRTLAQRLDDLDGLMDALGVNTETPLVTLGHDWGGVTSLGWAMRHREQVDAVITLNTAVDHPTEEPIPAALRAALAPGALTTSTVSTEGFLRVTLGLTEGTLDATVRAGYRAPYETRSGRGGIGGFVADIPADAGHISRLALEEISSQLARWAKPALVLWGPRDPVFQERHLADLLRRLPHADLHRFEGAGHLLPEDRDISTPLFTWLDDLFGETGPARTDLRTPAPAEKVTGLHSQLEHLTMTWHKASPAVVDMGVDDEQQRTLSWDELSERIDALAVGLTELGVKSGDRVSLLVQPGNDLTVILYACLRIGAVAVVADAGLGLRGMTRAVRAAQPEWIIGAIPGLTVARSLNWPGRRISVDALSLRKARILGTVASVERLLRSQAGQSPDAVPHPKSSDPAAVLFTSGSTGPAKGVLYTHERLGALVALLRRQFDIRPGSSLIAGFAPFALLGPAIGATSVTPDMSVTKPSTLTAVAVAQAALAGQATMFFGSPAALRNVVSTANELSTEQRRALTGIHLVLSAGAPVHPDLLDAVQDLFPQADIHTPYGMTEGLLQADISREEVHEAMTSQGGDPQAGVCVGRPVQGVRFALAPLDESGVPAEQLIEPQEAGGRLSEVVVSAAHLKAEYDRLWHTERVSRRDTHDGLSWHRSNDVGHIDDAGRLWIEGRLQHVISTPAGPVGPGAVETPVDALEEVGRSAAVGVGPAGTQAVVVVVEPEAGFSRQRRRAMGTGRSPVASPEFSAAVRAAAGEIPVAGVLLVDELPTDIRHNSKIDRTKLADWAEKVLAGERVKAP